MINAAGLYRGLRARLRPWRGAWRRAHGIFLAHCVRHQTRSPGVKHSLPGELVVSLTSYRPRFPTLHLSLMCLLSQSTRPDCVVLWVAEADRAALPQNVLDLQASGLTIETAPDWRSFKKIVPALQRYPAAFIATADDDVYYPHNWLAQLTSAYDPARRTIPCHRAHRLRRNALGAPRPYRQWRHGVGAESTADTFVTGVGGALFPPGSLHAQTTDADVFTRLCPACDDAWLYWMARRAGWRFQKIGPRRDFVCWPGSQNVALQDANVPGDNDIQIARLHAYFSAGPYAGTSPSHDSAGMVSTW